MAQTIFMEIQRLVFPRRSMSFGSSEREFSIVAGKLTQERVGLPDGSSIHTGDSITVKGYGLPRHKARIKAVGEFQKDKYGKFVFSATTATIEIDLTQEENIRKFLIEHVNGISEKMANKIVEHFGSSTLKVIQDNPNQLLEVKGIKSGRVQVIKEAFYKATASQGAAELLAPLNVPVYLIANANKHFGLDHAKEVILEKPYKLCEVSGFTFPIVHKIVQDLRMDTSENEEPMYSYAIEYVLKRLESSGSTFFTTRELVFNCIKTIGMVADEFNEDVFRRSVGILKAKGIVVVDWNKGNIGLKRLTDKELFIYKRYMSVLDQVTHKSFGSLVDSVARKNRISLHYKQAEAIEILLNHKYGILTGGPGTGKTTVLKCFIECFERQSGGAKVLCLAPTGRAASRMSESTGRPAFTIHSKLDLKPNEVEPKEGLQLNFDLVVVDESSMQDVDIAYALLKSLGPQTRLVLVGDEQQLPSVGSGAVLADLIYSRYVGVARLTKTFRQGADSSIVTNANLIKQGQKELITLAEDYAEIELPYSHEGMNQLVQTYVDAAQMFGEHNVVVLSPMRRVGKDFKIAVESINPAIQSVVNPVRYEGQLSRSNFTYTFRQGDRVMQMANTDTIMNGDVGVITKMDRDVSGVIYAEIDFGYEGANNVVYATDEQFNQLTLAYATTIHKSQGSEYPCVITPLFMCDDVMLQRNLLYTAVTRAKKKMIVMGEKEAINKAIDSTDAFKRNTLLKLLFEATAKGGVFKPLY